MTDDRESGMGDVGSRWSGWCQWVVIALIASLGLSALILPKSISWDPSYGMLAARHFEQGRTPDLLRTQEANPEDLTKDQFVERGYWAPGYQVIPWLGKRAGLSWGWALQVTCALGVAAGLAGWALYFGRILGWGSAWVCTVAAVAGARYLGQFAMVYGGGDLLVWAVAPWVILANESGLRSRHLGLVFLLGVATGGTFLLKYSAIFIVAGIGAFWVVSAWRRIVSWAAAVAWGAGAAVMGAGIKAMGFPAAGHAVGAARQFLPYEAVVSLGFPLLGSTDLEAVIARVCLVLRFSGDAWQAALPGLAGSLLLAGWCWFQLRRRKLTVPGSEAVISAGAWVALAEVAGLALLVFVGSKIAPQARLARVAGLLLLPMVVRLLWPAQNRRNWAGAAVLASLLALPGLYGFAATAAKVRETLKCRGSMVGPDGVACFMLDAAIPHDRFFQEVEAHMPGPDTVLVTPHAQFAFALPARRCVIFDAMLTVGADELQAQRWRGKPAGGVMLLVPTEYEKDPRHGLILKMFQDVSDWQRVPLATDPKWCLWIGS